MTAHVSSKPPLSDEQITATAWASYWAGKPLTQTVADVHNLSLTYAGQRLRALRMAGVDIPPAGAGRTNIKASSRPLTLTCECDEPFPTIRALTIHTVSVHRRGPTNTERTPR